jgi:hypothetical protein
MQIGALVTGLVSTFCQRLSLTSFSHFQCSPSFKSADELNQHIDNLPGGPEWKCVFVKMDGAPKEGPFPFIIMKLWIVLLIYKQILDMNYIPVEQYCYEPIKFYQV